MDDTADAASFVRFPDRTSTGPGDPYPGLRLLELHERDLCLDVGCGLGEDARAIAGQREVSCSESTGAGASPRKHHAGRPATQQSALPLPTERRLPVADSALDAAAVKRTLMHLADPAPVIREMARAVRPGGRVVIEPDSEVLLLDSGLVDVTRRILAFRAAGYANPWSGRRLRGQLRAAGLVDVQVEVRPGDLPTLELAERRIHLIGVARAAAEGRFISGAELEAWKRRPGRA